MEGARAPRDFFGGVTPARLGVAVSGGGDSMALLHHLLTLCGNDEGLRIEVATVDHGLRPEAAAEADFVAVACAKHGVPHTILHWTDRTDTGNLQAEARAARYRLLADWARTRRCPAVALGHTADDQAETILMNFARGSGIDGLCGMPAEFEHQSIRFIRPLLAVRRSALRAFLRERGATWIEDPSNEDETYTRVRARRLLAALGDLGLRHERVLAMSERMRDAREVLRTSALDLAGNIRMHAGDVLLPTDALRAAPAESCHRVFAAILCTLSAQTYRPRFRPLAEMVGRLRSVADAGQERYAGVLHGCHVSVRGAEIRFTRESAALDAVVARPGEVWDGRFRLLGPSMPGDVVRAFGQAAFGPLPADRDETIPRQSLRAAPAVWRAGQVVAAPLAGIGEGWCCETVQDRSDFLGFLISR